MVLGVTGNIASGKSYVAREFERLGAVVVDADQLAREAVAPGRPALAALVEIFGSEILRDDGHLNRDFLGRLVFADAEARKKLNAIVHPAIAELAEQRLNELRTRTDIPLIVYEAPLLFEAGAEGRVDRVLVVTIDPEIQLHRLMARDGLSETAARQRMEAQMPLQEKLARADYVIDNSHSLGELQQKVADLWDGLARNS